MYLQNWTKLDKTKTIKPCELRDQNFFLSFYFIRLFDNKIIKYYNCMYNNHYWNNIRIFKRITPGKDVDAYKNNKIPSFQFVTTDHVSMFVLVII